jgi:putative endonuclease
MSKGWMYILECSNGAYYTGSTNNLELRMQQHQNGEGANFTKKHLPVRLVYYEEFQRVDEAFYREKQVQGWSRKKKQALIERRYSELPQLSKNYTQFGTSTGSVPASVVELVETTVTKKSPASVVELVETTVTKISQS